MIDQKEINKSLDSYFELSDITWFESGALRVLIRLEIASPEQLDDRIGRLGSDWLKDNDYDTVETQEEGFKYLYDYFTQPYDNLENLLFDLHYGNEYFFPYWPDLEKRFKSILPHVIK